MFRPAELSGSKTHPQKDHISIVDIHLNLLVARKCAGPNTCYQPIFLPRDLNDGGVTGKLNSLVTGAWNLLWGEPYQPSMYRTRAQHPFWTKASLRSIMTQWNLRELMQHMHKASIRLYLINRNFLRAVEPQRLVLNWNPDVGQ